MEHQEYIDTKYQLKSNIRQLIFDRDPVLKQNLIQGLQILHSTEYPTQVFKLNNVKYIRINSTDIETLTDNELSDMIKIMLSTNEYAQHTEEQPDILDTVQNAIEYYQSQTGDDLTESELITKDEFNNITDISKLPLQLKVFYKPEQNSEDNKDNKDTDDDNDTKADDDLTESTGFMAKATGLLPKTEDATLDIKNQYEFIPNLQEIEQALEAIKTLPNDNNFQAKYSILDKQAILSLNTMVNKLLKAFKGHNSKIKQVTPKKHISAKTLATDVSEKIYVSKTASNGKHINLNLLIDMSGSMNGQPMRNAVSIIYLFNKLAQAGYVTGSVIYSSSGYHYELKMPISDAKILSLHHTQSSEGLADTVEAVKNSIKNTNLICITDGDIVDRPIDKNFWFKNHIVSTGVYINPSLNNVLDYTGKLDKWFNKSLVRQNLEDMIQLLIKIGIKG